MNKTLVTIDTGDIEGAAESMGIKLSKEEVEEIFHDIDPFDWDCESSTFNSFVQEAIRQFDDNRSNNEDTN